MRLETKKIYYFRHYYDNIEIGRAHQSQYATDGFQASSIVVKPFGVNRNMFCGRFSTPSLHQFLEHTISKDFFDFILGKYALLIIRIMSLLEKSCSELDATSAKAFYYIGNNLFTIGQGIYIGKLNDQIDKYRDYENIKILLDEFPQIKVSRHSPLHSSIDYTSSDRAKAISVDTFDKIKDLILLECSEIHRLLSEKLNDLESNKH